MKVHIFPFRNERKMKKLSDSHTAEKEGGPYTIWYTQKFDFRSSTVFPCSKLYIKVRRSLSSLSDCTQPLSFFGHFSDKINLEILETEKIVQFY